MAYFGFEVRNNPATRADHVVVLLRYAFGLSSDDAFETAMKIHKSGSEVVAVCEEVLLDEIQMRLAEANENINHPVESTFFPIRDFEGYRIVEAGHLRSPEKFENLLVREIRSNVVFLVISGIVLLLLSLLIFLWLN